MDIDSIPVVDLFAGPGGLGEGFSSIPGNRFKILVSAEKDPKAHQTLRLRSFYRLLRNSSNGSAKSYHDWCSGKTPAPWDASNKHLWDEAGKEARQLTLGTDSDNRILDGILESANLKGKNWVLIGGPPCQAFSLIGRARNKGKEDYVPEDDHRHFLYKEYLRIIARFQPSFFVMENVKGILSSRVGGEHMFSRILADLAEPSRIPGNQGDTPNYRIHSLVSPTVFEKGMDPASIDHESYLIKSEEYGIPQCRHRVILLGVREDMSIDPTCMKLVPSTRKTVSDAISDLPPIRFHLNDCPDTDIGWIGVQKELRKKLREESGRHAELADLHLAAKEFENKKIPHTEPGYLRMPRSICSIVQKDELFEWYEADKPDVWLNHESRSHMSPDLYRYLYSALFAEVYGRNPKGESDYPLESLAPKHKSWLLGHFKDRFHVQRWKEPASTVTSHISKDGHHFIHPDPVQNRSLTVREAARLQTFPDNYFFCGNRTSQYHQAGNAVPPLLARKIAELIGKAMNT